MVGLCKSVGKQREICASRLMFKKQIISFLLSLILCFSVLSPVIAHEREEHDADIEYVLFGNRAYKNTHPADKKIIQAIEDAVYLCIDQYNGDGKKELSNLLENEEIPGIIKSIDEINYTSNYTHRSLTHRGWNTKYSEKAHWPLRQEILIRTVEKELFSSLDKNPLSRIPLISDMFLGNKKYDKQCESFCVLLYCVHVLGDHLEAGELKKDKGNSRPKTIKEKTTALAYILPLANTKDSTNPGVIPDIREDCKVIFSSQSDTRTYADFIQKLEELKYKSERVYNSTGGVNTEEKFEEYNACAVDLLDTLGYYVPNMLKKEEFFSYVFYS